MKIIYNCEQGIKDNVALTFGNFDGVHLGHKFAISNLKKVAQERGLPSAVLTLSLTHQLFYLVGTILG